MVVVCGTVYLSTPEILTNKNSNFGAVSVSFEDPDAAYFVETDSDETFPDVLVLASTLNNIDYLAHGYNVYRGNPDTPTHLTTDLVDPGFSINKVFQFSYDKKSLSDDLNFKIPDYLTVKQE